MNLFYLKLATLVEGKAYRGSWCGAVVPKLYSLDAHYGQTISPPPLPPHDVATDVY